MRFGMFIIMCFLLGNNSCSDECVLIETEPLAKSDEIIVCHLLEGRGLVWESILISRDSLWKHKLHGDVIPDEDEDGCTKINPCHYGDQSDCDDLNPLISPGAKELCGDLTDNNCDQKIDENCKDYCVYESPKICNICEIAKTLGGEPDYFESCFEDKSGTFLIIKRSGSKQKYVLARFDKTEVKYSSSFFLSNFPPAYEFSYKISKSEYEQCKEALKKWAQELDLVDQCDI